MMRLLVTDSDWNLLRHARRVAMREGYALMAESQPDESLKIARRWRPDVIIASPQTFAEWSRELHGNFDSLVCPAMIVTADFNDPSKSWRTWRPLCCDVLIKPVPHVLEVYSALDAAAKQLEAVGRTGRTLAIPA
jgi:DNA-binding response OmpR family regulator